MLNAPKISSKFRIEPPRYGFWGPVRLQSRGFGPGGFDTRLSGTLLPGFNTGSGFTIMALADLPGSYLFTDDDSTPTGGEISAGAVTVYVIDVDNEANVTPSFVKFYNAGLSSITVGTTDPDMIVMAPAGERLSLVIPQGLLFATALSEITATEGGTAGDESPIAPVTVKVIYVP